jgi:hypothetical protein
MIVLVTLMIFMDGSVGERTKVMDSMVDCKHLSYQHSFLPPEPPAITSYSFCVEK